MTSYCELKLRMDQVGARGFAIVTHVNWEFEVDHTVNELLGLTRAQGIEKYLSMCLSPVFSLSMHALDSNQQNHQSVSPVD